MLEHTIIVKALVIGVPIVFLLPSQMVNVFRKVKVLIKTNSYLISLIEDGID